MKPSGYSSSCVTLNQPSVLVVSAPGWKPDGREFDSAELQKGCQERRKAFSEVPKELAELSPLYRSSTLVWELSIGLPHMQPQ